MATGSRSSLNSPRGKRLLAVLCAVAFLDFVDASITNVALPHIRTALGFSVQTLQWVPAAYLVTYGGLMLLGGRLADLFGRRRVLLLGTGLVADWVGAGLAPAPPTPPDMRVRIRRFAQRSRKRRQGSANPCRPRSAQ
jgi:MFS family permease